MDQQAANEAFSECPLLIAQTRLLRVHKNRLLDKLRA